MKGLQKAAERTAKKAKCKQCPYKALDLCDSVKRNICDKVFTEGFIAGVNYYKEHLWKTAADKSPKKNTPLLLFLSDDTIAYGLFEGWGYSFAVPEKKLHEKVEVVAWLYVSDLF